MNTLDIGHLWLSRFCRTLPNSSTRMRTRMAWRLAALSVATDEALEKLSEAELVKYRGGSPTFIDLRDQYLQRPR